MFMASFGGSTSNNNLMWRQWGLKLHPNDQLRAAYHAEMQQVLDSLGLRAPDMHVALEKGMAKSARKVVPAQAEKVAL
jgi:1,2-phenylacetyl-CoA epoxidase catalytic subunit